MHDFWNDPPDIDNGLRVCPKCGEEVEFSEKFPSAPINYEEEVLPPDFNPFTYDGPWPPPGTQYVTVNDGAYFAYSCPHCRASWRTR